MSKSIALLLLTACATAFYAPNFVIISVDLESFFSTVYSTLTLSEHLGSPFRALWTTDLGLGMPQPFAQFLFFHPIQLLLQFASIKHALIAFYLGHLLVAAFCMFAVCRHCGISVAASTLCGITFTFASPSINYTLTDFWPSLLNAWTMLPPTLLFMLRAIDGNKTSYRLYNALALSLCASILVLNGHSGVIASYALLLTLCSLLLLPDRRPLPLLLLAGILITVTCLFRFAYQLEEAAMFGADSFRTYVPYTLLSKNALWSLLLKPLYPGNPSEALAYGLKVGPRHFWFGPLFVGLTLFGIFRGEMRPTHKRAFAVTLLSGLLLVHLPKELCFKIIAWLIAFRDPAVLAGIILAGAGFDAFSKRCPLKRWLPPVLATAHVLMLAGGVAPFWLRSLSTALDRLGHPPTIVQPSPSCITDLLAESPVIQKLRELQRDRPGRLAYTEGIGKRFTPPVIKAGIWTNTLAMYGVPTLNGYFKGVYVPLLPPVKLMHSHIPAENALVTNAPLMNVLGVRYLLALATEKIPFGTQVARIPVSDMEDFVIYENATALPYAFFPAPNTVKPFEASPEGCENHPLLCPDWYTALAEGADSSLTATLRGDGLLAHFAPATQPRTLLVTQMFRPHWRVTGVNTDGTHTRLDATQTATRLTSVTVPPGITEVVMEYRPARLIFLMYTTLTMLTLLCASTLGFALLSALSLPGRTGKED
ncbi:putative membrane protein [Desulfovibrio sp. A2]|nr:putative membrane protein [Desulfovibrio sp. A2]